MILALLLVAAPWTDAGPGDKVAIRPVVDFTIAGAGLAGFVLPELLKQYIAPPGCNVCDGPDNSGLRDGSRGSLNGVDAFFHDRPTGWEHPSAFKSCFPLIEQPAKSRECAR